MKLTVAFMLVTLALCCYSASALLPDLGLGSGVVSDVVSVPRNVLTVLIEGVLGCVTEFTPAVQAAFATVQGLLQTVG